MVTGDSQEEVIIFRYRHTNRHCIIIYIYHQHQEHHHNSPSSSSNHLQVTESIIDNSLSLRVFAKVLHHSLSSSTRCRATGEMFLVIRMMVVMMTKREEVWEGGDSNDDAGCIENRLTLIISNLGPAIKRYVQ